MKKQSVRTVLVDLVQKAELELDKALEDSGCDEYNAILTKYEDMVSEDTRIKFILLDKANKQLEAHDKVESASITEMSEKGLWEGLVK